MEAAPIHPSDESARAVSGPHPVVGDRFDAAFLYASMLHRRQLRKGSGSPYVAHLLGVASLVLEAHGDEDQAIAALLHDAVEDQGGSATLREIRERFGDRVASIVEALSDPWEEPRPLWLERKRESLAKLRSASTDVLLVAAADKLYNVRALLRDHTRIGDDVWGRFRATREEKLWFYRELVDLFQERFPGWMADELAETVRELEGRAGSNDLLPGLDSDGAEGGAGGAG